MGISAFCWDADGQILYAVGPDTGSVYVMQFGSSSVRRLASLPKGSGRLSGLALDSEGGGWTTLRDGWSLVRLNVDGSRDRMIGLPVPSPTDLAFKTEVLLVIERILLISALSTRAENYLPQSRG